MKRFLLLGFVLFTAISLSGCACYGPGFGYGYGGACGSGYTDCPGVDYVDGGAGASEADCGAGCSSGYTVGCGGSVGGLNSCSPCVSCLSCVGDGIRVLGEGALGLVMAPFVLVGNILCNACHGYESYPNCGCSNEVYYGDNCYQPHDFCDPCACGAVAGNGHRGCAQCSGGYTEGVQAADTAQNRSVAPNQGTPVYRNARQSAQASQNPLFRQPARVQGGWNQSTQRMVPAYGPTPVANRSSGVPLQ